MQSWSTDVNRRQLLFLSPVCRSTGHLDSATCGTGSSSSGRVQQLKVWKCYVEILPRPSMEETKRVLSPIRFGIFEVDLHSGELHRQGYKIKLQEQPFQLLIMLLEHPGGVTREELQKQLWPADTFVDSSAV
jgi:DNA-binding response OmpR family regulator